MRCSSVQERSQDAAGPAELCGLSWEVSGICMNSLKGFSSSLPTGVQPEQIF